LSAIRFGTDYFYSNETSTYTLYDGTKFTETIKDNLVAALQKQIFILLMILQRKLAPVLEHSQIDG
jgi:hypothetical protein